MSNQESYVPAIPMYAVAMSDAIASGDISKMTSARDAALAHMGTSAELARLLPSLESAIKSKGGVIRPLYAVTIQDAVTRGDSAEISRIKSELALYNTLLNGGASANASVTPYGVAIQDAKARGDDLEVRRLTALAEGLLGQLNARK